MANVSLPLKIDIAGAFCVPSVLKDARKQYYEGKMGRQTLQAVEDAEVRRRGASEAGRHESGV